MNFDKNSLSKLLKLSDEELGDVIKEIAKEAGITDNIKITKNDVHKIRMLLTFATEEEISQLIKQLGGQKK